MNILKRYLLIMTAIAIVFINAVYQLDTYISANQLVSVVEADEEGQTGLEEVVYDEYGHAVLMITETAVIMEE